MKVEPNYEAESFTWRAYLQRVRKYADTNHVVELFTMGDKIFRNGGVYCVKYKYIRGNFLKFLDIMEENLHSDDFLSIP